MQNTGDEGKKVRVSLSAEKYLCVESK